MANEKKSFSKYEELKKQLYDGITLVEVLFLIGKYIQKDPNCTPFSTYKELMQHAKNTAPSGEEDTKGTQCKKDFYIKNFKKWNQVLDSFDVKGILIKNPSSGERYALSRSEAKFICLIFDRMEHEEFIWKKIRNAKSINDEYRGFLEIYYKSSNRRQVVQEIDLFIHCLVYCMKNILSESEVIALERHLLFVTQRHKMYMLDLVGTVDFIPKGSKGKISVPYYIEYNKFWDQMIEYGASNIELINSDFINKCGMKKAFVNAKKYISPIKHGGKYQQYMDEYWKKVNSEAKDMGLILSSEDSDGSDVSNGEVLINESLGDYPREWLADEILQMYQSEMAQKKLKLYQILRRLLANLQEIKPRAYYTVKYTDLKNPKNSTVYSHQGRLPASFPIDCFYASQKLSIEDRKFIYDYYRDYQD